MPPDYVYGDIALGVIATITAALMILRVAVLNEITSVARWLLILGWTVLALRIWTALYLYGDIVIHPVGLIALASLGIGSSLLSLKALNKCRMI